MLVPLISSLKSFYPWIALLAGFAGSLHCVGMCGGLVSSCCHNRSDIGKYQLGRLLGYILLGSFAAFLGSAVEDFAKHSFIKFLPSFFVGGVFIYWGASNLLGINRSQYFPTFLSKAYRQLWNTQKLLNLNMTRSFFIGIISILLPCGFLYGVILGTLATQNVPLALISIIFFWIGTLPAMVLAPEIFRNILNPFQQSKPKLYAICLLLLGLLTIGYRFYLQQDSQQQSSCGCHKEVENS